MSLLISGSLFRELPKSPNMTLVELVCSETELSELNFKNSKIDGNRWHPGLLFRLLLRGGGIHAQMGFLCSVNFDRSTYSS